MATEITVPKTLQTAIIHYANPDNCLALLVNMRWPDGVVTCANCGNRDCNFLTTRRVWSCKACRKQFSIKVGTFMEDSPIGLDKWLLAIWMVTNCKNGVSSYEIHRAIGITQKSAWFMLHRIRMAYGDHQPTDLGGTVEADETAIGGREQNKHVHKRTNAGRGNVGKAVVQAFLERGDGEKASKARTDILTDVGGPAMKGNVRQHVQPGSNLFTDGASQYRGLHKEYVHQFVDHAIEYVRDNVHTNSLENFFSLLKRMIKGTYVSVDAAHLAAYLDEQTFRFNERKNEHGDSGRFLKVTGSAYGKRLTYEQLTGRKWLIETF